MSAVRIGQVSAVVSILAGVGALLAPHGSPLIPIFGITNLAMLLVAVIAFGWYLTVRAGKWR